MDGRSGDEVGVDDVIVPIRWESVQEGFLGGEGGWCFMGLTLLGG